MITAETLRKQFEVDLKALQNNCPHEKSTWMEYHWAPGHNGGMCKVCDVCEKMLNSNPESQNQHWTPDDMMRREG